ncbi:MAG: hypothetical protein R3E79_61990 [Caldilineaceae bacterium]
MNRYGDYSAAWGTGRSSNGGGLWSNVTAIFRRQPEWVLAGAVVGGALLAFWAKNAAQSSTSSGYHDYTYRGDRQRWTTLNDASYRRPVAKDAPYRRPADHLGATEAQMDDLTAPSQRDLDAGTAGATGAAYELDPDSITAG